MGSHSGISYWYLWTPFPCIKIILQWCILDDPGENQAPAAGSVKENMKMYWKSMGENLIGDDCINMRTPIRVKWTLIRQLTGSILRLGIKDPMVKIVL